MKAISRNQLKALQSLWALYAKAADLDGTREARLAWAAHELGRVVGSFNELRSEEAVQLIELLKRAVGQEVKPAWPRIRDRQSARAAGTHGRRGRAAQVQTMATAADLARVEELRAKVSMTPEDFGTWLRSRSSPLGWRATPALRTLRDVNRVLWALKAMLRRAAEHGRAATVEEVSAVTQAR